MKGYLRDREQSPLRPMMLTHKRLLFFFESTVFYKFDTVLILQGDVI